MPQLSPKMAVKIAKTDRSRLIITISCQVFKGVRKTKKIITIGHATNSSETGR